MATKSIFSWRGLVLMAFCAVVVVGNLIYLKLKRVDVLPSEVEQPLVVETAPTELPSPPFAIPAPPAPDSTLNGQDLTKVDSRSLFSASNTARRKGEIQTMVQLQHWGVVADETSGLYNLACCYGITGDADAALYWLQRAAVVEGVDAQHASTDRDLSSVRGDERWMPVLRYLAECGAYWRTQPIQQIETILPAGYANEPIPVLVGLHGTGHNAKGFIDADYYQTLANEYNYAVVAVSGTRPSGPNSFGWAEDMTLDHAQIQDALRSLKDRLTPKKGAVVLFGFSQGGAVAAGLTANYPDEYAGAIGLSSGTRGVLLPPTSPTKDVQRTRNVMACGAGEHPRTVATTKQWAEWFAEQGAETKHKVYAQQQTHSFPHDFAEAFPNWISFILEAR